MQCLLIFLSEYKENSVAIWKQFTFDTPKIEFIINTHHIITKNASYNFKIVFFGHFLAAFSPYEVSIKREFWKMTPISQESLHTEPFKNIQFKQTLAIQFFTILV
jgi:hypothetical protein